MLLNRNRQPAMTSRVPALAGVGLLEETVTLVAVTNFISPVISIRSFRFCAFRSQVVSRAYREPSGYILGFR